MPTGIQRLNAKKSQPNPHIVFIKPLKGPDEKTAQDYLERIAAQCLPVMRQHRISVMSLEEYEPNAEFVGRNFNAGEVVQLVLRSARTGRWLPFNYVQMVMMHELAHCKQMNHSRLFWSVRNQYADEMRALWARRYTGDGLWGRGCRLATGKWERNVILADEGLPEHFCGGTYRSRRRGKRKAGPELSSRERKERRILRKFGPNGIALGADEESKVKLEGKRVQGTPRVAGSARGRELRAAAALARFEVKKTEEEEEEEEEEKKKKKKKKKEDRFKKEEEESETGSDCEDEAVFGGDKDVADAVDIDGTRLLDAGGRGMVKMCGDAGDEVDGDGNAATGSRNEMSELRAAAVTESRWRPDDPGDPGDPDDPGNPGDPGDTGNPGETRRTQVEVKEEEQSRNLLHSVPPVRPVEPTMEDRPEGQNNKEGGKEKKKKNSGGTIEAIRVKAEGPCGPQPKLTDATREQHVRSSHRPSRTPPPPPPLVLRGFNRHHQDQDQDQTCDLCSFANPARATTCKMCAHVLSPENVPGAWACAATSCQEAGYVNAGDCGVCGLCGKRRRGD